MNVGKDDASGLLAQLGNSAEVGKGKIFERQPSFRFRGFLGELDGRRMREM